MLGLSALLKRPADHPAPAKASQNTRLHHITQHLYPSINQLLIEQARLLPTLIATLSAPIIDPRIIHCSAQLPTATLEELRQLYTRNKKTHQRHTDKEGFALEWKPKARGRYKNLVLELSRMMNQCGLPRLVRQLIMQQPEATPTWAHNQRIVGTLLLARAIKLDADDETALDWLGELNAVNEEDFAELIATTKPAPEDPATTLLQQLGASFPDLSGPASQAIIRQHLESSDGKLYEALFKNMLAALSHQKTRHTHVIGACDYCDGIEQYISVSGRQPVKTGLASYMLHTTVLNSSITIQAMTQLCYAAGMLVYTSSDRQLVLSHWLWDQHVANPAAAADIALACRGLGTLFFEQEKTVNVLRHLLPCLIQVNSPEHPIIPLAELLREAISKNKTSADKFKLWLKGKLGRNIYNDHAIDIVNKRARYFQFPHQPLDAAFTGIIRQHITDAPLHLITEVIDKLAAALAACARALTNSVDATPHAAKGPVSTTSILAQRSSGGGADADSGRQLAEEEIARGKYNKAFVRSAEKGFTDIMDRLYQQDNTIINAPAYLTKETALFVAIKHNQIVSVRWLLQQPGLDLDRRENFSAYVSKTGTAIEAAREPSCSAEIRKMVEAHYQAHAGADLAGPSHALGIHS